jgi:hypothetical protein
MTPMQRCCGGHGDIVTDLFLKVVAVTGTRAKSEGAARDIAAVPPPAAAKAGGTPQAPAQQGRGARRVASRSIRGQDLAFQRAMARAVAAGMEKPPLIGVYKDPRPLDAPRLFAPVQHSSGCTSPAHMCADAVSTRDHGAALHGPRVDAVSARQSRAPTEAAAGRRGAN